MEFLIWLSLFLGSLIGAIFVLQRIQKRLNSKSSPPPSSPLSLPSSSSTPKNTVSSSSSSCPAITSSIPFSIPNSSSDSYSPSSSADLFPTLGIKLNHLNKFILNCGGRENLENLTTTEVRDQFIIPMTFVDQNSYCEMIKNLKDENEREDVGEANVFISHVWSYKFLEVVDLLLQYFNNNDTNNNNNEEEIIIWFDIFSVNQRPIQQVSDDYWYDIFKTTIQKFGRTVMVLAPWNDPRPLTRAWCLWELYCTVITGSKFEIAMTNESKQQFIEDILTDPEKEINKMLSIINVERSECWLESDKERIFNLVKGSIGFSNLNKLIFERLREWVIEVFENKLKLSEYKEDTRYLNATAGLYKNQGKYDKSEELYVKCLKKRRQVLGNNHPDTLQSINNLAVLYKNQGKYDKSEELYIECLQKRREILGDNHPNTLNLINNLGLLYSEQGKYDFSEELYIECLQKIREILGDNHPDTLSLINNLGLLYSNQGKYDFSEELYVKCLKKRRQVLGNNHPDTLQSINNLGLLYSNQGKYDKSEELYIECLKKRREILGDNHPDTLNLINNLAALHYKQGKYDKSEDLYIECLVKQRQVLGNDHPDTLSSINNIAGLYLNQGKYDKSEELYVKCLKKRREILGNNHPNTLQSINNLGLLYLNQGKYNKSEELYIECLEKQRQVLGNNHPDTLQSINNLAALYNNQGKYDKSEELFKECLEKQRQILGNNHPDTLLSINNLGLLYYNQGKYDKSEILLKGCFESVTVESLEILRIKSSLGELYSKIGRYDEAEFLLKECLTSRRNITGNDNPETIESINRLALLYFKQNNFEKSESLMTESLKLSKEIFGSNHPDTIQSMNNLAILYDKQGKFDESDKIIKESFKTIKEGDFDDNKLSSLISGTAYGVNTYWDWSDGEVLNIDKLTIFRLNSDRLNSFRRLKSIHLYDSIIILLPSEHYELNLPKVVVKCHDPVKISIFGYGTVNWSNIHDYSKIDLIIDSGIKLKNVDVSQFHSFACYSDDTSSSHKLEEIIKSKNFAFMCGAGVSMSMSKQAKPWGPFIDEHAEVAKIELKETDDWLQAIKEMQDNTKKASRIANELNKGSNLNIFRRVTRKICEQMNINDPSPALILHSFNSPILTTNYDTLIKQAICLNKPYGQVRETLSHVEFLQNENPSYLNQPWDDENYIKKVLSQYVVHVHGIYSDVDLENGFCLTKEEYENPESLKTFLKFMVPFAKNHSLIFVGAEGTITDSHFQKLWKELEGCQTPHFILTSDQKYKSLRDCAFACNKMYNINLIVVNSYEIDEKSEKSHGALWSYIKKLLRYLDPIIE